MKDGLPIGLGYIAVSFALGIAARNAGLNAAEGAVMSILNHASAGEYAGILSITTQVTLLETALVTLIANLRYFLMSCALSQKAEGSLSFGHRLFIGFGLTDEIFAISVAREGALEPLYVYGSMAVAIPMWAAGTALGILLGNILPANVVSALSVALYGMFIAVIVPKGKADRTVAVLILISFAASFLFDMLPALSFMSDSMIVIVLTVVISLLAAWLAPVKEERDEQ